MSMPACVRLYVTRVAKEFECDAFFPEVDEKQFQPVHVSATCSHGGLSYDFTIYERNAAQDEGKTGSNNGYAASAGAAVMVQQPSAALAAAGGAGQFLHEEYQYLQAIQQII